MPIDLGKIECQDYQGIKTNIDLWIPYIPDTRLVIDTFDGVYNTQIFLNYNQMIQLHHKLTLLIQLFENK